MIKGSHIVVLTGAGVSAESGINTFRDAGGLWEGHDIMDVATPEAWQRNPDLVLEFYNQRRAQLLQVQPNDAHIALAQLQECFEVSIITQNVDDLHERAGSRNVLHLHGELRKARSQNNPHRIYTWDGPITRRDKCEDGHPLRPHIVWFGETVPLMDTAVNIVRKADLLLIVGTSLVVYPAAGLIDYAHSHIPIHYVDPRPGQIFGTQKSRVVLHQNLASEGVCQLVSQWMKP